MLQTILTKALEDPEQAGHLLLGMARNLLGDHVVDKIISQVWEDLEETTVSGAEWTATQANHVANSNPVDSVGIPTGRFGLVSEC